MHRGTAGNFCLHGGVQKYHALIGAMGPVGSVPSTFVTVIFSWSRRLTSTELKRFISHPQITAKLLKLEGNWTQRESWWNKCWGNNGKGGAREMEGNRHPPPPPRVVPSNFSRGCTYEYTFHHRSGSELCYTFSADL